MYWCALRSARLYMGIRVEGAATASGKGSPTSAQRVFGMCCTLFTYMFEVKRRNRGWR